MDFNLKLAVIEELMYGESAKLAPWSLEEALKAQGFDGDLGKYSAENYYDKVMPEARGWRSGSWRSSGMCMFARVLHVRDKRRFPALVIGEVSADQESFIGLRQALHAEHPFNCATPVAPKSLRFRPFR